MPRFRFALSDAHSVREVGLVQTESFDDALVALADRFHLAQGDQLEIGVYGFPPARYRFVTPASGGDATWQPLDRKAA